MVTAVEPLVKKALPETRKKGVSPGEQYALLTGIRWETYEALLDDLGDCPIRLTYDRGSLEIMTTSSEHETYKSFLGRFVEVLTLELRIPIRTTGSTTLKRQLLQRGLEFDESYYVTNEAKVRHKLHIDIAVDPPPDLALEIDVSRSSVSRKSIYAALRVPELWRFNGEELAVHLLNPNGEYERSDRSRCFPFLPLAELEGFLKKITEVDETSLLIKFQEWVRRVLAPIVQKETDAHRESGNDS